MEREDGSWRRGRMEKEGGGERRLVLKGQGFKYHSISRFKSPRLGPIILDSHAMDSHEA